MTEYEDMDAGLPEEAAPVQDGAAVAEPPAEEPPKVEPESQEEPGEDPEHKRRSGVQRLKAKLDRAGQENEILRQQLAQAQAARPQEPRPLDPNRPSSEDPRFKSYDEYLEALTDWKANEVIQKERVRQEQAKIQAGMAEAQKNWAKMEAESLAKHDDYDDITDIQALGRAGILTPDMADTIYTSETGPELLYWLGTHEEEARRIASLPPKQAARELGRIESRLVAAEDKPAPKPKISQAPPPIPPVASRGAAPAPSKYDRFEEF